MNDNSLSHDNKLLDSLAQRLLSNSTIPSQDYERYNIKRGLRNSDNTGVMAGITRICSVDGYYIDDGEKVPKEGHLRYRGLDLYDFVAGCKQDERFGFEELVYLLLFGELPNRSQLDEFKALLSENRELPFDFIEDVIMRAPSPNIMNKLGSSVTALYAYDENPDDISVKNVLRQSVKLIAMLPSIMAYAYQVKRRYFYKKSMYIHTIKPELGTAETVLRAIRSDKTFSDKEAKLLDLCLMIHADHGGGNNSTFSTRVLTSSGTDTYSAITAGLGSLKGPRHGGANIKVAHQMEYIMENLDDSTDDKQVRDMLARIMKKEAGDGSGLIYGMGHAVYTLSDPRAVILKRSAKKLAFDHGFEKEFMTLDAIERLTPQVFAEIKGVEKPMCANVDLYSGLVYRVLGIPEDLYTPLFATARVAGWCAHRLEELTTSSKIMRPAYKSVTKYRAYTPLSKR